MSLQTDRLSSDLKRFVRERHPDSSPKSLHETALYLRQRFSELRLSTTSHTVTRQGAAYQNMIGMTSSSAEHPLFIAAHYDTVAGSPGADDNASALAVLLDVAYQIRGLRLKRPVGFIAFCLEEEDLRGSRAFVAQLKQSAQAIQGAIVLECVGYARHEEGTQKIPPGVPVAVPSVGNFLAVIGNQRSQALTMAVAKAVSACVPVVPLVVPGNGEELPDTRRSDHTSFWEQGFPAVMLTDTANFRNPHYHRPTDTMDTLDLKFMASVADGVAAAVRMLNDSADVS